MVDPNALQLLNQLTHMSYEMSLNWRRLDVERFRMQELATPRYTDPKRLVRHGFKVYSQSDEDGIIQEIFKRIGTTSRTFIEFGVETGVECNSVKLLVEGWSGLWIEAAHAICRRNPEPFRSVSRTGQASAQPEPDHRGEYQHGV